MIITAIAAVTRNQVIGKDNGMPWHLPADLAYFKKTTMGHHILMGRTNFRSIGRPLPGRTNVILTRDLYFACSNCLVAHSIEEALSLCLDNGETEAFIIGGGSIYRQSLPYWDRLYLTEIHADIEGDVFFPEMDWTEWELQSDNPRQRDEKNIFDLNFKVFHRKK